MIPSPMRPGLNISPDSQQQSFDQENLNCAQELQLKLLLKLIECVVHQRWWQPSEFGHVLGISENIAFFLLVYVLNSQGGTCSLNAEEY